MKTKVLEIRDSATCMPVLCVELIGDNRAEELILWRSGWQPRSGQDARIGGDYHGRILLVSLADVTRSSYDPYGWPENPRTLPLAHRHITKLWATLNDGDVIDVQFLEGETASPKLAEIVR
jgi:hypothetical protein